MPSDTAGRSARLRRIRDNLALVIKGKEAELDLVLLAVVAGGHVLIEDIPGVGKTTLARSLARTVEGSFRRIQFTPDLLPTDITGVNIFHPEEGFSFRPGPIFANIVLADEINRASPRTQSALLEAMSDEQVTIDGTSHRLPSPFTVVATQNPIEYHGTYPIPEAQLDRFMIQTGVGYPPEEEEHRLVLHRDRSDPVDGLGAVVSLEELEGLRTAADGVEIESSVGRYLFDIVRATREHPKVQLGVSPRGSLLYARIVRALAFERGRDYVLPDDIKQLAVPALAHRILLDTKAKYEGVARSTVIGEIVDRLPVPR